MTKQQRFFQSPRLWGLLWGLTLAVAQFFTPLGGMGTAQAATLTVTSTADSGAALAIAWRREPGPLSAVLVTVNVAACAVRTGSATPIMRQSGSARLLLNQ